MISALRPEGCLLLCLGREQVCVFFGCILMEVKYNVLSVKTDAGSFESNSPVGNPKEMPGFWKGLQELLRPGGRLIRIFPMKTSQFFA